MNILIKTTVHVLNEEKTSLCAMMHVKIIVMTQHLESLEE